jgi:hypothetical protein
MKGTTNGNGKHDPTTAAGHSMAATWHNAYPFLFFFLIYCYHFTCYLLFFCLILFYLCAPSSTPTQPRYRPNRIPGYLGSNPAHISADLGYDPQTYACATGHAHAPRLLSA